MPAGPLISVCADEELCTFPIAQVKGEQRERVLEAGPVGRVESTKNSATLGASTC